MSKDSLIKKVPIILSNKETINTNEIRYSEYLPIDKVFANLYRLNMYYEVNLYKGTYYKKTKELKIGPFLKDEVAVRMFPLQKNNNGDKDWLSIGMLTTKTYPNDIKVNVKDVFDTLPPDVSKE